MEVPGTLGRGSGTILVRMHNRLERAPSDPSPPSADAPSRAGALPAWVLIHAKEAEDRRAAAAKDGPPPVGQAAAEAGDVTLQTVRQAAARAQLSPKTIYRLIARGELPAVRIGRSVRLRQCDLEALFEPRLAHGDY